MGISYRSSYKVLCVFVIFIGFSSASTAQVQHTETAVEEIIVSSSLHRSRANTALPVNVLAGEELREKASATLGETLQSELGVTSSSFGAGVGQPIIRGLGANRVQVLQGGVGNMDVSSVSADHANSIEPVLAERIEVLRGPSTLLYGNGAIGGVVNIIDNRIPTTLPTGLTGLVETRHNNVSDQQVSALKVEGASGQVAWHIDGIYRDSNNVEIDGFAINPDTINLSDGEELEALLRSKGEIENSDMAVNVRTVGASWILDEGYIGFSVNRIENNYGIPLLINELIEEIDLELPESQNQGSDDGIRIAMEQQRIDVEGLLPLSGFFEEIHGRVSQIDYQHAEIEGNGDIGTIFDLQGIAGRFSLHLATPANREGVLGLQFGQREFSATGEEAYIPKVDINSLALFTIHSLDVEDITYEFGLRGERISHEQSNGSCDKTSTSWSGSLSSIWRFRDDANMLVSLAHSQRSATVEELFSNIDTVCGEPEIPDLVLHGATQRFEIGIPNANREKSTNIELGFRKHAGDVRAELNLFYNDIKDFIYLLDSGNFNEGFEISRYTQENSVFKGVEVEISFPLFRVGAHSSELSIFSDYVSAEFQNTGNVPRIPPLRYGAEISHSHTNWQLKLQVTRVAEQSDTAEDETRSEGYTLLGFYGDYHIEWGDQEILLFAKGNNLLDEKIRNHTSLLKDVAPAAGRAIEVGIRYEF